MFPCKLTRCTTHITIPNFGKCLLRNKCFQILRKSTRLWSVQLSLLKASFKASLPMKRALIPPRPFILENRVGHLPPMVFMEGITLMLRMNTRLENITEGCEWHMIQSNLSFCQNQYFQLIHLVLSWFPHFVVPNPSAFKKIISKKTCLLAKNF